jgi:hypothetical protein
MSLCAAHTATIALQEVQQQHQTTQQTITNY